MYISTSKHECLWVAVTPLPQIKEKTDYCSHTTLSHTTYTTLERKWSHTTKKVWHYHNRIADFSVLRPPLFIGNHYENSNIDKITSTSLFVWFSWSLLFLSSLLISLFCSPLLAFSLLCFFALSSHLCLFSSHFTSSHLTSPHLTSSPTRCPPWCRG